MDGYLVKQWYFHSVNDTALLEGVVALLQREFPLRREVLRYKTVYGVQSPARENWAGT